MSNVLNEGAKIIRSGILYKYSQRVNSFEECQFKLHQDYLMYTKINKKGIKISQLRQTVTDPVVEFQRAAHRSVEIYLFHSGQV
jgi:hypothetical protein